MQTALKEAIGYRWPFLDPGKNLEEARSSASTPRAAVPPTWLRQVLHARASRGSFFGSQLFADPAWDLLLELYWARIVQQRVAVTRLCEAVGCPTTTGLRWISALHKEDLVTRTSDRFDGRRVFIELSDKGSDAMDAYFSSLPDAISPLGARRLGV